MTKQVAIISQIQALICGGFFAAYFRRAHWDLSSGSQSKLESESAALNKPILF